MPHSHRFLYPFSITQTPFRRGLLHRQPLRATSLSSIHQVASKSGETQTIVTRSKNLLYGTSLSLFVAFTYLYITDTRASVHQWLVVPSLRWLYPDAEEAHRVGIQALKALYSFGLHPRERNSNTYDSTDLSVTVFGQKLQNPIGTSAGIDKLAEIPDALLALGPAIVEVGGVTPYPQDGNSKPRVFRLPSQKALINRYGLYSLGAEDMAMRLRERVRLFAYRNGFGIGEEAEKRVLDGEAGVPPGSLVEGKMLAVQVAKNKFTKDEDIEAVKKDYMFCVDQLAPYADILVVNVSSPNTPGLRTLQRVEPLTRILEGVVEAARRTDRKSKPRVMVKISPDEDNDEQIKGIVEAIWKSGVDGVIVGNTTKRRQGLIPSHVNLTSKEKQILEEQGGYSGPQMFNRTLSLVKRYRRLLDQGPLLTLPEAQEEKVTKSAKPIDGPVTGDEPDSNINEGLRGQEHKVIFATGGITNGQQALEILNAGGNIAQLYTTIVYDGVGAVSRIKKEMRDAISTERK